jgi:hypothetical protein
MCCELYFYFTSSQEYLMMKNNKSETLGFDRHAKNSQ